MNESQTTALILEKNAAKRIEAEGDVTLRAGGVEINLGDFTRTSVLMKSLRLMLNNQVVVPTDDLAGGVGEAGRKFKMGDIEQANHEVARLYSAFGQKTNQWESQARRLEQQMKTQAAKDPKAISMNRMNEMKAEQVAVRTRIRTADVQFRRLHQGLEAIYTSIQRQPARKAAEPPGDLPAGFLTAFQAAQPADREGIVREHFDVEAVLQVDVSKREGAGFDVKFDPLPTADNLYYLVTSGQIIRLRQLRKVVRYDDLEKGQESEMKLSEFVKQVRGGAWVLNARS